MPSSDPMEMDLDRLKALQELAVEAVEGLRAAQRPLAGAADDLDENVSAVYLLIVRPELRSPFLGDVHNWYSGWSFYVGETKDLKGRLATHARTLNALIDAEAKRAEKKFLNPEVTLDGLEVTWILVPPREGTDPRHERKMLEALLVASLSPVANDLGFGRGRRRKYDMWSLLGPMRHSDYRNAIRERSESCWSVYDFEGAQSIHLRDPLNPDEDMVELDDETIDREVDELLREWDEIGPTFAHGDDPGPDPITRREITGDGRSPIHRPAD